LTIPCPKGECMSKDLLCSDFWKDKVASRKLKFYPGDSLKFELLSTDKKYFDYFFEIALQYNNGINTTTPYTPKGNFNNGALGYFGIYSVSGFEFVVP